MSILTRVASALPSVSAFVEDYRSASVDDPDLLTSYKTHGIPRMEDFSESDLAYLERFSLDQLDAVVLSRADLPEKVSESVCAYVADCRRVEFGFMTKKVKLCELMCIVSKLKDETSKWKETARVALYGDRFLSWFRENDTLRTKESMRELYPHLTEAQYETLWNFTPHESASEAQHDSLYYRLLLQLYSDRAVRYHLSDQIISPESYFSPIQYMTRTLSDSNSMEQYSLDMIHRFVHFSRSFHASRELIDLASVYLLNHIRVGVKHAPWSIKGMDTFLMHKYRTASEEELEEWRTERAYERKHNPDRMVWCDLDLEKRTTELLRASFPYLTEQNYEELDSFRFDGLTGISMIRTSLFLNMLIHMYDQLIEEVHWFD